MVFTCFEISRELLSIGIGFMSDLLQDNELNLGLSSTDKFGNLAACSVWVENGDRLVGWVADLRKRELSKLWLSSKRGNGAKCPRSHLLLLWRRGRNPEQGDPEITCEFREISLWVWRNTVWLRKGGENSYDKTRKEKLGIEVWGKKRRRENKPFISHIRYGEGKKRETNLKTFVCFMG